MLIPQTVMFGTAATNPLISESKGNITITAILYGANGKALASDTVQMYSDAGFFQQIGGFFRTLLGLDKILAQ